MKRFFLREEAAGKYSIRGFGAAIAGADGKKPFHFVVESRSRDLVLEFPETYLFDLFTHFDLKAADYLENRFASENFVQITMEARECVIQANSGTLYDFFKERAATGNCVLRAALPISFYWKGATELDAA